MILAFQKKSASQGWYRRTNYQVLGKMSGSQPLSWCWRSGFLAWGSLCVTESQSLSSTQHWHWLFSLIPASAYFRGIHFTQGTFLNAYAWVQPSDSDSTSEIWWSSTWATEKYFIHLIKAGAVHLPYSRLCSRNWVNKRDRKPYPYRVDIC